MIDPPTPAGFVADAEEALGKARAMRDHHLAEYKASLIRIPKLERYLRRVQQWELDGATWPLPKKPCS